MSITAEYQKSMDEAARGALRSLISARPTTSIADLRELVGQHPSLGGVTLSELVGDAGASAAPARRGRPAKAASKATSAPTESSAPPKSAGNKRAGGHKQWNTRTEEGREELDRAVLEALSGFGGVGVSAEAIRARLGATPAQIRTSLNRYIESGEVSFSGKARGTRYTLEV